MACAAHGSTRMVSWHTRTAPLPAVCTPLFANNDIGEAHYRAIHDAAHRLWRDHRFEAPLIAAAQAQSAFWQGNMDACRWWHRVGRMLDRALEAGSVAMRAANKSSPAANLGQVPVNS